MILIILSPRFDFVRSVSTQILPIRLQDGQELTAKVLKHITGTSPIYVRTHKIVNAEDDVRCFIKIYILISSF